MTLSRRRARASTASEKSHRQRSRRYILSRHARGSRNLLRTLIGECGRSRARFSRAVRRATQAGDAADGHILTSAPGQRTKPLAR
jgi:hypothetical protein